MDAFDPIDVYELIDVMDWWGPGDSLFASQTRTASFNECDSGERPVPVTQAQPIE